MGGASEEGGGALEEGGRTHLGAVLAGVPPVPVLCIVPLGAGLALCGAVRGAVLLHGHAGGALVTQQQLRGHGVTVLVLRGLGLQLERPGEGGSEELWEEESGDS